MNKLLASLVALIPAVCLGGAPEYRIFHGINSIRSHHGLATLAPEPRLTLAARSQCEWMASVDRMDHMREPAGSFEEFLHCDHHPANRVVKAGYFKFEDLFRVDRGPNGVSVTPLPAANDKVGEIIARGAGGPGAYNTDTVLGGWMRSPGHREEILQENFREVGVAFCSPRPGVTYWCVVFGCK